MFASMRSGPLYVVLLISAFGSIIGCQNDIPDQSQFASLDSCANDGQALARVYGAPAPPVGCIAIHTWFVVKNREATQFDRWDLIQDSAGPFGHIQKNILPPESGVGAGGTFIIAELKGLEAEPIVEFIQNESQNYPARDCYYFLGPNSNTYIRWTLKQTGWDIELPDMAIGKNAHAACP